MIGLIASRWIFDWARNWPMDQSAHSGSFSRISTRTLVSTSNISLHPGSVESVGFAARTCAYLVDHHIALAVDGEIHRTARRQIQRITNLLGDGDLTFTSERRRHEIPPFVLRHLLL